MEVKDVRSTLAVGGEREVNLKRSEAGAAPAASKAVNPITVDISVKVRNDEVNELRRRANSAINVVNLADEAASEIDRLVRSIGGIVEQVADPGMADRKRRVLEREANELVQEIRFRAKSASPEGVKPLAGDKVELEIEQQLGKTLEIIFPDSASNSFGISELDFSKKDTIIQARVSVAKARDQVERIKESIADTSEQVRAAVSTLEVAMQNSEAAEVSIRDLDAALKLVTDARGEINANPEAALESVGELESRALSLLKS